MSFLLSAIFAFSAFAIEGDFIFSGEMDLVQHRKIQVVPSFKTDVVKDLKAKGYTCESKPRFFKCTLFVKPPQWPTKVVEAKRARISFGLESNKELIAEGDLVTQYKVDQIVTVDGEIYKGAQYTLTKDLTKVKVGLEEDKDSVYFIIGQQRISELQFPREIEDRFNWQEYMVMVHYDYILATL